MQHNKSKKKLSEINNYCTNSSELVKTSTSLLKELNLSYINYLLSKSKIKGIKSSAIFQTFFILRF